MDSIHEPCSSCGAPSTLLCDFKIGGPIDGYVRKGTIEDRLFYPVFDLKRDMFTCDTPLCEACTTKVGSVYGSGASHFRETVDHCPYHRGRVEAAVPITDREAETMRRDIIACYRRRQLALTLPTDNGTNGQQSSEEEGASRD